MNVMALATNFLIAIARVVIQVQQMVKLIGVPNPLSARGVTGPQLSNNGHHKSLSDMSM